MFFFGKKIAKKKVSHFDDLKAKFTQRHKELQTTLWQKHGGALKDFANSTKHFAVGSLAAAVMLASPGAQMVSSAPQIVKEKPFLDINSTSDLLLQLHQLLPSTVMPLTPDQEQQIGDVLTKVYGVQSSAVLDGIRLNRSYGYIGQEQHLARFPGDNMDNHFTSGEDAQQFYDYGMAPGLGAWGYFTHSASQMAQLDIDREKYYIAVQTFLAPGYNENVKVMSQFFKYRKMLVVNPDNGKALIADIADAGPAEWTGKSLGGSPEVMKYLERVDGATRGPVLYFFVNDPDNKIPLGPIQTK